MNIPEQFKDFITSGNKREIDYRQIKKSRLIPSLTKEQVMEDFDCFKYILENAYSGRDYFDKHVKSFDECYASISDFINSRDYINVFDMMKIYCQTFEDVIFDAHFKFCGFGEVVDFYKHRNAYFADIIIEKIADKYIVVKSNINDVKINDVITCNTDNLFPTLSPKGRELYLYGVFTFDTPDNVDITVNNEKISIPVHRCKASEYTHPSNEYITHKLQDEINVVTMPTFDYNKNTYEEVMSSMYACGEKLKNENNVIWNIMANGGGTTSYPTKFIEGLNEYSNYKNLIAVLHSHVINSNYKSDDGKYYREWEYWLNTHDDKTKAKFDGTLYVLINSGNASSGECAIDYARNVKKCVTIGENTMGCGTFGETLTYELPHTKMTMQVASKIFLVENFKEGEGFLPDFWVDNADVKDETVRWLNNPETYMPNL